MTATKTKRTPRPGSWAADTVERYAITKLVPYAQNSRIHSEDQIDRLAKSITEFGFTQPVLIDENDMIIAGHGRVLAASRLGLTNVPVIRAKKWSDEQKRAYVIADNRLAELAVWDMDKLVSEAQSLMDLDFDLDLVGIDEEFLGLDDGFDPELSPTRSHVEITESQIERAGDRLENAFAGGEQQDLISIICPHCAEEFEVSGS